MHLRLSFKIANDENNCVCVCVCVYVCVCVCLLLCVCTGMYVCHCVVLTVKLFQPHCGDINCLLNHAGKGQALYFTRTPLNPLAVFHLIMGVFNFGANSSYDWVLMKILRSKCPLM